MAKQKGRLFPTFAVIVFILALLWAFEEMDILVVNVPWFPIIIGIVALGWIVNFYHKKK